MRGKVRNVREEQLGSVSRKRTVAVILRLRVAIPSFYRFKDASRLNGEVTKEPIVGPYTPLVPIQSLLHRVALEQWQNLVRKGGQVFQRIDDTLDASRSEVDERDPQPV